MEKLFTYGSLQYPDIQMKLFNSTLVGTRDILIGYEKGKLEVEGKTFNIATPNPDGKIEGTVYDLTDEQLARADRYEGKGYKRIRVSLLSGSEVWLYVRI